MRGLHKKTIVTYSLIAIIFSLLLARLYYIVQNKPAQVAGTQNRRTVVVSNTRGTIYDTNLEPFVNEAHVYSAAVAPSESLLSHLFDAMTKDEFTKVRDRLASGAPAVGTLIKPIQPINGIIQFLTTKRYGNRLLAPHVIGYLDNGEMNGVYGIERDYNALLSSYSGKATASFYTDANGRYLAGIDAVCEDTTSRSKGGIVLTLDKFVQQQAENIAAEYMNKGSIIIMRPNSGEITALVSTPSFQPHTVAKSIESNDGALLNRALSLYDCGSVFKIITTAAALENNVSTDTTYECCGFLDVEGVRFHCHNRLGHGKINMNDAFAQSCNLYYIQLAQQIGADNVYSMAEKFQLNAPISLTNSLTAPKALLPDPQTIRSSTAALANFSFGQGYLMVSPLHVTAIANTIANDGILPSIHIVKGAVDNSMTFSADEEGRGSTRIITSDTAKMLGSMMQHAVQYGTGQSARPNLCSAAGKTGTAETGQRIDGRPVTQSWFVGYFPAESPQYVVCVLTEDVDNAKANSAAIFKKIADTLCKK